MRILLKEFPTCAGAVLSLVLSGCASQGVTSSKLAEINQRQVLLQGEMAKMAARLEKLENSLLLLQNQMTAPKTHPAAAKKTKNEKRPAAVAPEPVPEKVIVVEDEDLVDGGAATDDKDAAYAAYQKGFELYEKQDYDETLVQLEKFVREHPQHELANQAIYWMGEVFFSQQEYELAIQEFERVRRDYPQGNRVPDAIAKMALAQDALGNKAEARRLMQEVLDRYPQSKASQIAKQYLQPAAVAPQEKG